ncbi:unnamed protein product, partial [Staurois parvus]
VPLSGLLTLLVCSIFCHRVLADYGPSIATARPVICHGPLYRLLMLLPGPECVMGPCTASHCCCLHRHTLPCATFRSPHTAVCSIFCHRVLADYGPHCCCQAPNLPWAPVPPPHAAARSTVSHGSLYGLPLLLSPSRHSAMCHFQVSSHTAGVFHFL